jgi:hypothetical protein
MEPIKERPGEPIEAEDFHPFLKGQVRGQYEAVMLIGPADDLEEPLEPALEKEIYPSPIITIRWSL